MIRKELMCNFIFYYLEPLKDQDQPFSKVEIVLQNSENFNKKCQWNGSENIMTIDLVTIFEQNKNSSISSFQNHPQNIFEGELS